MTSFGELTVSEPAGQGFEEPQEPQEPQAQECEFVQECLTEQAPVQEQALVQEQLEKKYGERIHWCAWKGSYYSYQYQYAEIRINWRMITRYQ